MFVTPDPIRDPLYVIVPLFNPVRYKSRWKHWRRFVKYATDSGATVIVVECAFGDRLHACETGPNLPCKVVKVRGRDELWVKENLINIGLHHLPAEAKYV